MVVDEDELNTNILLNEKMPEKLSFQVKKINRELVSGN